MLRNNRVIKIEDCIRNGEFCPLESLYPEEICKLFIAITPELESRVTAGWVYKNQVFIEPVIGEYITELNQRYFPDNIGVIYGLFSKWYLEAQLSLTEQDLKNLEMGQHATELELRLEAITHE